MIFVILGLIVSVGLYVRFRDSYYSDIFQDIVLGFLSGCGGFTVGGIISLIFSIFIPLDVEYELIDDYELISLQDNSNISGSFMLGSETIENVMYYTFYYKIDDGVKFGKVETQNTTIYFIDSLKDSNNVEFSEFLIHTENKGNRLKIYKYEFVSNWKIWVSVTNFDYPSYIRKIYIPENSVIKNFNLDAK